MKTISAEEFKKKFGVESYNAFDDSQKIIPNVDYTNTTENPRNILGEAVSAVTSLPKNISNAYDSGIDKAAKGMTQIFSSPAVGNTPVSELGRGVLNLGSGLLESVFSPLTGTVKSVTKVPGISDSLGLVEKGIINPTSDAISNIKSIQKFAMSNPNAEEVFSNGLNILLSLYGAKKTPELNIESKVNPSTTTLAPKEVIPPPPKPISIPTTKISSGIMNRVARMQPSDMISFKKISGKTPGEYLVETGNFGPPDKIIVNEAEKFVQSKSMVDSELSKLPGVYKYGAIGDALNALVKKAKSISSENVPSSYFSQVQDLVKKYNAGGLSMEEINQVKRLFEREVKLGYKGVGAQINAPAVEKATNIDSAIRKWQVEKAKSLGFNNISELNKQTQLSKFIIDNLGDKVIGQSALNNIGLTDWIVLGGGTPTAIGGFLVKKFFGSRAIQAKIAEMLNIGEPVKNIITPDINPTVENTLRQRFPNGVPLQLPEGTSKTPIGTSPIPLKAPVPADETQVITNTKSKLPLQQEKITKSSLNNNNKTPKLQGEEKIGNLYKSDYNVLSKYIDAVRLKGKPEAPNMTESDWLAAEDILEKTGSNMEKSMAQLANDAEKIITGRKDIKSLYQ